MKVHFFYIRCVIFTCQTMQTILIVYVSHAHESSPLLHRLRDIYLPNNANNSIRFEQVQSLAGLLSNTESLAK